MLAQNRVETYPMVEDTYAHMEMEFGSGDKY